MSTLIRFLIRVVEKFVEFFLGLLIFFVLNLEFRDVNIQICGLAIDCKHNISSGIIGISSLAKIDFECELCTVFNTGVVVVVKCKNDLFDFGDSLFELGITGHENCAFIPSFFGRCSSFLKQEQAVIIITTGFANIWDKGALILSESFGEHASFDGGHTHVQNRLFFHFAQLRVRVANILSGVAIIITHLWEVSAKFTLDRGFTMVCEVKTYELSSWEAVHLFTDQHQVGEAEEAVLSVLIRVAQVVNTTSSLHSSPHVTSRGFIVILGV